MKTCIYHCLYLFMLMNISILFAILVVIRLGILLITKGPRKMFKSTQRESPPTCLMDPKLGTHGYLYIEDVRIHYVSKGDSDKPLMLLMHGFPESWYSWRHQLKEFSDNYRVVAVDLRGYGDSDKPSGISQYKMDKLVKDVKQIITALGYSSCVLVGHDWGGAIAWIFSGLYPEMVEKVIVLNCPHPHAFKKYLQTNWAQLKKSWYMFFFLIPILPDIYVRLFDMKFFDIIFRGTKGGVLTNATTQEDVDAYKYLFSKRGSLTGPMNYIRAALLCRPESTTRGKVKTPVLLLWGCRDLAIEKGQAEKCKDYAEDLTIKYLHDASHWVQMDEPDTVNLYIREFIQK
ncbi:epoxide hydrolase 4-like isoform X2 [Physella acuta]|nr:epoxide hydrolase 4-like isoform X2 [Physella acuta]XP_059163272.1 epoxide hydrolase 4-like isoform X2 [Physella acuta]XP_059163273.1 epoxide hydrolase 4-like isoform X2 [Physella acuta]